MCHYNNDSIILVGDLDAVGAVLAAIETGEGILGGLLPGYRPQIRRPDFVNLDWIDTPPDLLEMSSYPPVGSLGTAAGLRAFASAQGIPLAVEPTSFFETTATPAAPSGAASPVAGSSLNTAVTDATQQIAGQDLTRIALFDSGDAKGDANGQIWDCLDGNVVQVNAADPFNHGTTIRFLIEEVNSSIDITTFRVFRGNRGATLDALAAIVAALWAPNTFGGQFDQFVMAWTSAEGTCGSSLGATLDFLLGRCVGSFGYIPALVTALPNDPNEPASYPAVWPQATRIAAKDWSGITYSCAKPSTFTLHGGESTDPLAWIDSSPCYGTSFATALAVGAQSLP